MRCHNLKCSPDTKPSTQRFDVAEVRRRVLLRLETHDRIWREWFLVAAPARSKQRNKQLRVLNAVFQQLVVEGILFTVDRAGDHAFFQHHGRAFPKMWRRRRSVTKGDK